MMTRFHFSDPSFDLPDVESVLDALESAVVGPETPMFDAARQSWQPVARHPEVRAAWAERARYRPPDSALELPPLPEVSAPVGTEDDEAARRRAAYAMVLRGNRLPIEEPPPPEPKPRRSIVIGMTLVLVVLVLIGVAAVELASGLLRVAVRAVRMAP
jgi:hypothetical protein